MKQRRRTKHLGQQWAVPGRMILPHMQNAAGRHLIKRLLAAYRRVCATEKTGRCPERPLSSRYPFDLALATKGSFPPLVSNAVKALCSRNSL